MKKFILQSVVLFFVSLLLFTSCMGPGRNVESGQAFGVVRFDYVTGKFLLDVGEDIAFYHIRFQDTYEDNCFWIYYELDFDRPENSMENVGTNGYFTVDILDKIDVDKWGVSSMMTDTSKVLQDEVEIVEPAISGDFKYINGKMFIISILQIPTDQKMNWNLSYDLNNMSTDEYNQRIYNVYIRSSILMQGTRSKDKISFANAFEMKYFMDNIVRKETELGGSSFKIRFNFPSSINENGQIKWDHRDTPDIHVSQISGQK